jgi:hypothetical protein
LPVNLSKKWDLPELRSEMPLQKGHIYSKDSPKCLTIAPLEHLKFRNGLACLDELTGAGFGTL